MFQNGLCRSLRWFSVGHDFSPQWRNLDSYNFPFHNFFPRFSISFLSLHWLNSPRSLSPPLFFTYLCHVPTKARAAESPASAKFWVTIMDAVKYICTGDIRLQPTYWQEHLSLCCLLGRLCERSRWVEHFHWPHRWVFGPAAQIGPNAPVLPFTAVPQLSPGFGSGFNPTVLASLCWWSTYVTADAYLLVIKFCRDNLHREADDSQKQVCKLHQNLKPKTSPKIYSTHYISEMRQYEDSLHCVQLTLLIFSYGPWRRKKLCNTVHSMRIMLDCAVISDEFKTQKPNSTVQVITPNVRWGLFFLFWFDFWLSPLQWQRCKKDTDLGYN